MFSHLYWLDYNSLINHIINWDYHWWLKTRVFLTLIIRSPVYNSEIKLTLIIINDTIITFLTTRFVLSWNQHNFILQSVHPSVSSIYPSIYLLGLGIDQFFRYDICIDTKWSVFDISFDIYARQEDMKMNRFLGLYFLLYQKNILTEFKCAPIDVPIEV